MSKKTSKAEHFSLRINPDSSSFEKEFLRILHERKADGFSVKKTIIDAVLAREGFTPEMFADGLPLPSMMLAKLERMFDDFAKHIVNSIQRDGITAVSQQMQSSEQGKTTAFTRNFVNGLKARSKDND